jgi:hypothetical protein
MVNMNTVVLVVVAVAAISATVLRHLLLLRIAALAVILLVSLLSAGGLIAPHRLAEERVGQSSQNGEWQRGARDTRDAVYRALPVLSVSFFALVLLALVPPRAKRII